MSKVFKELHQVGCYGKNQLKTKGAFITCISWKEGEFYGMIFSVLKIV